MPDTNAAIFILQVSRAAVMDSSKLRSQVAAEAKHYAAFPALAPAPQPPHPPPASTGQSMLKDMTYICGHTPPQAIQEARVGRRRVPYHVQQHDAPSLVETELGDSCCSP